MDEWERYTGEEHTPGAFSWNKTTKQEALYLLRKLAHTSSTATASDIFGQLNRLTHYHQPKDNGFLNYAMSVDSCLFLPLPPSHYWSITRYPDGESEAAIFEAAKETGGIEVQIVLCRGTTLPLAMLQAWWEIQQDN